MGGKIPKEEGLSASLGTCSHSTREVNKPLILDLSLAPWHLSHPAIDKPGAFHHTPKHSIN